MKQLLMVLIVSIFAMSKSFAEENSGVPPATPPSAGGTPLSAPPSGVTEAEKPLEVSGQSRSFSLMMVSREEREALQFASPRSSYEEEISETPY